MFISFDGGIFMRLYGNFGFPLNKQKTVIKIKYKKYCAGIELKNKTKISYKYRTRRAKQ